MRAPESQQQQITLLGLLQVMLQRWKVVVVVVAGWLVLGVATAFVITPTFRAEVLLMPTGEEGGLGLLLSQELGMLRDIAGIAPRGSELSNEAIATLRSRALADAFISDRKLLPVLFEKDWDAEKQKWDVRDQADAPTFWDAYERFDKSVRSVDENKRTGLVTLRIEWTDPVVAADWANDLARRANAMLRQRALERAGRNVEYLQREAARTSIVELQQAVSRLLESQLKQLMLARVNEEYAFKVIDAAVPPERPVRPKRLLIVAISLALGVLCAALFIWAREYLTPS